MRMEYHINITRLSHFAVRQAHCDRLRAGCFGRLRNCGNASGCFWFAWFVCGSAKLTTTRIKDDTGRTRIVLSGLFPEISFPLFYFTAKAQRRKGFFLFVETKDLV
jgi:hypothetical protein